MTRTSKTTRKKGKSRTVVTRGGGWFSFGKTEEEKKIELAMEESKKAEKALAEQKIANERNAAERKKQESVTFQTLIEAIKTGNEATVQEIVRNRPNINKSDEDGFAPLHYAVIQGNRAILKILTDYVIRSKSSASMDGTTPMFADDRDSQFQTPLFLAYLHKQYDSAKMLKDAGADINRRDHNGDNLLMKLINLVKNGSDIPITVEIVEKMLEDGADPYMRNRKEVDTIGRVNLLLQSTLPDGASLSEEDRALLRQMNDVLVQFVPYNAARRKSREQRWGGSKKKHSTRRRRHKH